MSGYRVPARVHRMEEVVRRSRFLATLGPAGTPEAAHALIRKVEAEFPDATHHVWAFVAGPPGSTAQVGLSDAGEPHGTAGRPILNTLLHAGVGEIAAVVTRWFGGVKLGRGGLGRAYAGAVASALETLPTVVRVTWVPVRVRLPWPSLDPVLRLLDDLGARDRLERYLAEGGVEVEAFLPEGREDRLAQEVASITRGASQVTFGGPEGR